MGRHCDSLFYSGVITLLFAAQVSFHNSDCVYHRKKRYTYNYSEMSIPLARKSNILMFFFSLVLVYSRTEPVHLSTCSSMIEKQMCTTATNIRHLHV